MRDCPYSSVTEVKQYAKYYRKITRSFLGSIFNYTCQKCRFKNDTRMFHFHHREPTTKEAKVNAGHKDKVKMFKEMLKCDYLCENCHYEAHAEMGDIDEDFKAITGRRYSCVQNMLGCSD